MSGVGMRSSSLGGLLSPSLCSRYLAVLNGSRLGGLFKEDMLERSWLGSPVDGKE